jgi:hypothetical protein
VAYRQDWKVYPSHPRPRVGRTVTVPVDVETAMRFALEFDNDIGCDFDISLVLFIGFATAIVRTAIGDDSSGASTSRSNLDHKEIYTPPLV